MPKQTFPKSFNERPAQELAAISLFGRPDVNLLMILIQQNTTVGRIARGHLALAQIERHRQAAPDIYMETRQLILENLDMAWRAL